MTIDKGKLAIVTGASTGIGYELAKRSAEDGFDLLIRRHERKFNKWLMYGFDSRLYARQF